MGQNLVIVESPAKAKTIEKFLGEGYTVKSSFGHIRDLEKKGLGIDVEGGFEPKYEIPNEKKKVVSELKDAVAKADTVWLASDEDREGEAIAWHLYDVLGLNEVNSKRIVFHEITKNAILDAIKNPRSIDMNLVMAQQARRVLDRLVGFELSPLLWKKVQRGLSAGRVQSVALRLIVDREREILSFKPEQYYKVEALFTLPGSKKEFKAALNERFSSKKEAAAFLEKCINAGFRVIDVENKQGSRTPSAPFTTSSLQQEAARKLGFSVSQTMSIAQKLYEAGLITYMRTDSTNLSSLAINTAKEKIIELFGENYSKVRNYHTKVKGAQEAHEAIRPTYIANEKISGTAYEQRLYNLIWQRTVACQMADAKVNKTVVTIGSDAFSERFVAEGETILFDGFMKVYLESRDDEEQNEKGILPAMGANDTLSCLEITAKEKYSQRPARYSEASLVKKLEDLGIGRPSTYAPTINTICERGYVTKGDREGQEREVCQLTLKNGTVTESYVNEVSGTESKKLFPENIGMIVTDFLVDNFADILDYGFTANVEEDFDKVASGNLTWNKMIGDFYPPFHQQVSNGLPVTHPTGERVLGTDPETGRVVIARMGPYGAMVQLGANEDEKKSYASLLPGQLIESITLEDALQLLVLPRKVGQWEGKEIVASIGRFGPYVKYDGKFISLGKEYDPHTVTEEEAIALIKADRDKKDKKNIKEFPEKGIQVLNGPYGAYIKQDKKNYKIPKGVNASDLTLDDCLSIINDAANAPAKPKRGGFRKKAK